MEFITNFLNHPNLFWYLKHLSIATTVLGSLTLGLVYIFQSNAIYLPSIPEGSRRKVDEPSRYDMPFEDVVLRTKDGIRLAAYLIKRDTDEATKKANTVIYFCANAGNMGHRLPLAKVLYRILNCNIFLLSYRGYGYSEGTPNEQGIKLDAEAALEYIRSHELLKDNKVVLYGQSIGGAVAIDLASRFEDKIDGLIIENTFLSLPKLIPNVIPVLRYFTFLCHQRWESEKSILKIEKLPCLFLSGLKDSLIPPQHMKELYNLLPSKSKQLIELPNGEHNDTFRDPNYFKGIEAFWEKFIQ